MFWAYILYSDQYDKYYIGYTNNLQKRVIAHNHIKNKGYTKKNKSLGNYFILENLKTNKRQ
jgi:putative endonuclease